MAEFELQLFGENEVLSLLQSADTKVNKNVRDALIQVTAYMEGEVKQSIAGVRGEPESVDTGRYLGSIDHAVDDLTGYVWTDVEYAKYLEFGTVKMAPRMHFLNSLARNRDRVKEFLKEAIQNPGK